MARSKVRSELPDLAFLIGALLVCRVIVLPLFCHAFRSTPTPSSHIQVIRVRAGGGKGDQWLLQPGM